MNNKITPLQPDCQLQSDEELTPIVREVSLNEAVNQISYEIEKTLDHGCSGEAATATSCNNDSEEAIVVQSNSSMPNVAIELLSKLNGLGKSLSPKAMASYNDSNRVPDHATRWNSR